MIPCTSLLENIGILSYADFLKLDILHYTYKKITFLKITDISSENSMSTEKDDVIVSVMMGRDMVVARLA